MKSFASLFTVCLIISILMLVAMPKADATIRFMKTNQMEAASDEIVTATVSKVNSTLSTTKRYVETEVQLKITSTIKGDLNKDSTITIKIPGGTVGNIVCNVPEMPTFVQGKEAMLYLEYHQNTGYRVVAGRRGLMDVQTNTKGVKYVTAPAEEAIQDIKEVSALKGYDITYKPSESGEQTGPQSVTLDEMKAYLHKLQRDREQEEAKKK